MENTQKNNLRIVIFAGGVGTRMWPLSRKATPKQFEKIINNKSTLQLAVERVRPETELEDIYISTGKSYIQTIKEQLPKLPNSNLIGEPEMRDVAPAVGYLMAILAKKDPWGPVAILWSDHLMDNVQTFKNALQVGGDYLKENRNSFVFLGQKARFANQNLGWIQHGEKKESINGFDVHEFVSWHYRPEIEIAKKYFKSDDYTWNPGYFVVTPQFVLNQFKKLQPKMYEGLMKLQESYGTPEHTQLLDEIYPKFEKISFDDAIVTKTSPDQAVVIPVDLGWSDVGTWEALKEALQENPEDNIEKGKVVTHETKNSVIYNYTDKLVTSVGAEGMIVVVTNDVIMVAPQESIPDVKKMLKKFEGTDLEKFT
ncbi:mannose-1-phosphate guanylyltransferase [Patescibacteria group bacterium]